MRNKPRVPTSPLKLLHALQVRLEVLLFSLSLWYAWTLRNEIRQGGFVIAMPFEGVATARKKMSPQYSQNK